MNSSLLGSDSSDSNSNYFEVRYNVNPMSLSSPLTRKYDDDEDISGREAMLRRRKQPKKTTTTTLLSSATDLKMTWTKNDELLILQGIVDYQNEKKSSYSSDWNAFYDRIRSSMESDFSKKQLINKVKKLKKRFRDNQVRANDGRDLSFVNTHDEEVFKLSKIIWAEKETEGAYEEHMDQTKCLVLKEDVPCAEHERVSNTSMEIDNGEREKIEEDGVDDVSLLQDALEVAASFLSLSNIQRKSVLGNLRNVGAQQRKELTDEWKALLTEDMQLDIKKQSYYAKLVNAGFFA